MAIPKITGSGPNSRTNLKNIHSGERSFQKDLSTTHSQIALMQRALSSLGYDTQGTDGIFGNNTESAVKSFQRSRGLTVDGYFGKNSLLALEGLLDYHLDSGDGGCDGISPTIFIGSAVITTLSGVRFRKTPGGNVIKKVDKGVIMTVTEIVESDQYKWYKGIISNDAGYLREDCIAKYTGSPNDTVSDSMDFSDIVTITPKVTTYYNFSIPSPALPPSACEAPQCITPPRNVPEVSMTFRQENSTPMRVRTPRMASFPAADGAFRSVGSESASDSAAEEIVPGAELNDVVVSSGRLSDGAAFVSGAGANSSSVAASCQI